MTRFTAHQLAAELPNALPPRLSPAACARQPLVTWPSSSVGAPAGAGAGAGRDALAGDEMQPSARWMRAFWREVARMDEENPGAIDAFASWPLVPVLGGELVRVGHRAAVVAPPAGAVGAPSLRRARARADDAALGLTSPQFPAHPLSDDDDDADDDDADDDDARRPGTFASLLIADAARERRGAVRPGRRERRRAATAPGAVGLARAASARHRRADAGRRRRGRGCRESRRRRAPRRAHRGAAHRRRRRRVLRRSKSNRASAAGDRGSRP